MGGNVGYEMSSKERYQIGISQVNPESTTPKYSAQLFLGFLINILVLAQMSTPPKIHMNIHTLELP